MYKKFLLWCKALLKNDAGLYLQLWTSRAHDRAWVVEKTMRRWLPGWRIEIWESCEDALRREVLEETWLVIDLPSIMYLWTVHTNLELSVQEIPWEYCGLMLSFYECSISWDRSLVLSDEHEAYRRVQKKQIIEDTRKIAKYPESLRRL
jgi:8-oxo-dGTP pyrophosphatase MutT (NUDIX family)